MNYNCKSFIKLSPGRIFCIWFGFLDAQAPLGIVRQMESRKICISDRKA